MITTPQTPRCATAIAVLALVVGVLPVAGVAGAQEEQAQQGETFTRGTTLACPEDAPDAFVYDDRSAHHDAINCLAFWEVVSGVGDGVYDHGGPVPRVHMAIFVAQMMETAPTFDFSKNPPDAFTDDEIPHEEHINKLADAGVIEGTAPGTYRPARRVQRNAMAKFIVNALEVVTGQAISTDEDFFDDDEGDTFEEFINKLASIGVVQGDAEGNYNPGNNVDRASMASFIARGADYLAEQGHWPPLLDEKAAYLVSHGNDSELTFAAVREYSVEVPAGTSLNIRLFPATDVSFATGAPVFSDSADPSGVADENAVDATIIAVNGASVAPSQEVEATASFVGQVTFVIQATSSTHVILVVWTDVEGGTTDALDLNDDDQSAEPVGLGGKTHWALTEATDGFSTPTVQGFDADADEFAAHGRTYRYDSNDTFQYTDSNLTDISAFESLLNPGDLLYVTYDDAASGTSTFNIVADRVHNTWPWNPLPTAKVVNDDGSTEDTNANDVLVSFTLPWNSASGVVYKLQHTDADCSSEQQNPDGYRTIEQGLTRSPHVENDEMTGCWVYRIVAVGPAPPSEAARSGDSNVVRVPSEADDTPPTIDRVVATADNDANGEGDPDGIVNTGDEHRFRFSEVLADSTATGFYRVSDADGTVADIVCSTDDTEGNADCELNPIQVVTGSGDVLEPGQQLDVTLTGDPTIIQRGGDGALSYPVTIVAVSPELQDEARNQLELIGSDSFIEVEE